jgi:hypothetical protein
MLFQVQRLNGVEFYGLIVLNVVRIRLKWIFEKWNGGHLAQDRDRWRTLANEAINLRVA